MKFGQQVRRWAKQPKILAGVAGGAVMFVTVSYLLMSPPVRRADQGMGGRTDITPPPTLQSNPMQRVGPDEANRRVTLNVQKAEEAKLAGKSYMAPPVVARVDEGDALSEPPQAKAARQARGLNVTTPALPAVAGVENGHESQQVVHEAPPVDNQLVQEISSHLSTQVDMIAETVMQGGEASKVLWYSEPKPKQGQTTRQNLAGAQSVTTQRPLQTGALVAGANPQTSGMPVGAGQQPVATTSQYEMVLAAKPGDIFYATLKIGFNSDDPQGLPIFATIHDARPDGTLGPLDGAVVMGAVNYTEQQAAVTFTQMILTDGRQAETKSMAVKLDTLRAGIAQNVNNHTFAKYGAMTVASLLQGAGEAGQMLIQNDRSYYANNSGLYSTGNSNMNWGQVGLAAAQPLGNNLSSALSQSFNRPATKSSKPGMEIGVVFLQSVMIAERHAATEIAGTEPNQYQYEGAVTP
ncbi:DotG/IcmE/VirB10 family protein [Acetobacter okinawensis]|uniref:DotG/IcmE/VirB10 family protein n=1 Tax=Acetobacter okinawensis TaxID=1076594 RepID=UPI001BAD80F4|nr:DotG/IcmE/VirB10 family protein [Acetobacter okinawensis]MBS0987445.1 DotG/IcmE/VirB10 family protein [Acetobacter okinawensis]